MARQLHYPSIIAMDTTKVAFVNVTNEQRIMSESRNEVKSGREKRVFDLAREHNVINSHSGNNVVFDGELQVFGANRNILYSSQRYSKKNSGYESRERISCIRHYCTLKRTRGSKLCNYDAHQYDIYMYMLSS